ncbi:MAG: cytochrome c [Acidobacteria bacterium]|nr:cytochrome c [Acidobacteriota bacterium]
MTKLHLVALALVALAAAAPARKADLAARGKQVFERQCAVCHHADSTGRKVGPGLKGLFKRPTLAHGRKVSEASVRAKIDDGGNGMPSYKEMLSDDEKNAVIAYLKTL